MTLHVDGSLARAVELAEEDPLPRAERERPVLAQRDDDARPHERRADVRRRVLLARLDVLPRPAVLDHPLERRLEVARDRRVGVLVDRHARGRVRDVDEDCGASLVADARPRTSARDVDDVAPPRRAQPDLVHVEPRARRRQQAARRLRAGSRRRLRGSGAPRRVSRLSFPRSTTASSSVIDATSSRCSWRNQCEELLADELALLARELRRARRSAR